MLVRGELLAVLVIAGYSMWEAEQSWTWTQVENGAGVAALLSEKGFRYW
jgi:hypothetical protein